MMMTDLEDTIVAVASTSGGWRGVIRLSGPQLAPIFSQFLGESFEDRRRGIYSVSIHLEEYHSAIPADLYWMPAPYSYTGQHCAELHTTGSAPILESLVTRLLRLGARAAGPGEFTLRAFLAGKKDLTQAEAVQAVVAATNQDDLINALQQLSGGISHPLQTVRDDLLNLLADIEAALDFSTEDIEFVPQRDILLRLASALAHLKNVQRQLSQRSLSEQRFRVALAGLPNAGKSTLFNALIGQSLALVSDVAGTTRDYLSHVLVRGDLSFELIDTAGIQATENTIEQQAQTLRENQYRQANLILWCVEVGQIPENRLEHRSWTIYTKADQFPQYARADQFPQNVAPQNVEGLMTTVENWERFLISAKTLLGINELRDRLFAEAEKYHRSSLAPSLSRCQHHIDKSIEHLQQAHRLAVFDDAPELLALEIRLALQELGEMVGAIYTNDLLDRIFTRFCIGK